MQSISVYTTAAKVPFGRKTVQTELEADAETPSRELERRPSDVAVPSGRSLLSSEDDKRGISPMKKLKHLMTGRRGFKVELHLQENPRRKPLCRMPVCGRGFQERALHG